MHRVSDLVGGRVAPCSFRLKSGRALDALRPLYTLRTFRTGRALFTLGALRALFSLLALRPLDPLRAAPEVYSCRPMVDRI